jgi:lipoprotein-anchoring transpeptidase ErfK/SrfK
MHVPRRVARVLPGTALLVAVLLATMMSGAGIAVGATGMASAESTATTPTPTPPPPPAPPAAPVDKRPIAPSFVPKKGKAIYLNRAKQRIYLYVDGRQIDTFLCSTSRSLPRRGKYYYQFKRPASMSYNGAVTFRWQTVFTQGPHGGNIGFHTIPVNRSGHEIAPVGKPVSHGCVRCPKKKALFLYRWITKKTPIIVRP